jgi:retinol dehydrogenase 12
MAAKKWSFFGTLRLQRQPAPPVISGDLSGKTVMMIGASSGIGLETTKHLCRMGPARVIFAVRNEQRGRRAAEGARS